MPSTPLIKFTNIYLKREDLNPTGSAKDRAIELQVNHLKAQGFTSATISSTGNAAISAIYYCHLNSINLSIFVSPKITQNKLKLLNGANVDVHQSLTPNSDAFKYCRQHRSYFLRQSTDPIAQIGYQQIAKELLDQLPQTTSIFIPVGSGTTLLGISRLLPINIQLFAIQPASYCPIASIFDSDYTPETTTLTDALAVKYLPLKNDLISTIHLHRGSGVVVQNHQIVDAQHQLNSNSFQTSPEGALALAGFNKLKNHPRIQPGNFPVILFTGTQR